MFLMALFSLDYLLLYCMNHVLSFDHSQLTGNYVHSVDFVKNQGHAYSTGAFVARKSCGKFAPNPEILRDINSKLGIIPGNTRQNTKNPLGCGEETQKTRQ